VKSLQKEHNLPRLAIAVLLNPVVYLQCSLCSTQHHLHYATPSYCPSRATSPAASHTVSPPVSRCAIVRNRKRATRLAGSTLEGLAEHEQLYLIVDGEHTGTSNTSEDVGTSALEE